MFVPAIPIELFEMLNTAVAAVCIVVLCYCGFYFLTEYRDMRRGLSLTLLEAASELSRRRLAIGTAISFLGVGMRAAWVATAGFLEVLGYDISRMGKLPLVLFPIGATLILILGGGCVARAILPRAWGRWAYVMTIGVAVGAVALTQMSGIVWR